MASAGFRWWEAWGPGVVGGPCADSESLGGLGDDR